MAEVYEPVQLIVDNLVLSGLEANLASTNAVSKAYVDAHITSAVSSLVNAAPATLDTLKEIATALGNDANLATTLANSISSEGTARSLADAGLQTQINALSVATGGSGGSSLQSQISAEVTARANDVTALYTKIDDEKKAEISARDSAIAQTVSSLSETTDSLQGQIDAEVSARGSAIDAEVSARGSAITAEVTARNLAISTATAPIVASATTTHNMLLSQGNYFNDKVTGLENNKLNKAGGVMTGDLQMNNNSYLKFSDFWRVSCSNDGSKILFQHKKADGIWRTAVPFICSV